MNSVLIISDDTNFNIDCEKVFQEIGSEVAVLNNESNALELIQDIEAQFIILKGSSEVVNSIQLAQKIKKQSGFKGKVVLILTKTQKVNPDEINQIKMDYLLFEPVTAIDVLDNVMNLIKEQNSALEKKVQVIQDKNKKKINFGSDNDVIHVTGKIKTPDKIHVKSKEQQKNLHSSTETQQDHDQNLQNYAQDLINEIEVNKKILKSKIDVYNQSISNLNVDLKKGHNKKTTKQEQNSLREELLIDPGQDKLDSFDKERQVFAVELAKKAKNS